MMAGTPRSISPCRNAGRERWKRSFANSGLYIHTQALDTSTPAGRAMFQMLGIFSEFEREMIRSRVQAGMARVKCEIDKNGRYETKKGTVIKRFGLARSR